MIKNLISTLDGLKESYNNTAKTNPFFIYFSCWILLLLFPLVLTSKYVSFILINHLRSFPADIIFTFFTIAGNGIILIPLTILLFIRKKHRILIGLLLSMLITTLAVNYLKHTFNHLRPLACYGEAVVQTAHWITRYSKHSFPSGHTASAFCMAAYLSLSFYNDRKVSAITFVCAALTGYSRIYLGEHFLEDVWVGSIVGVLMAAATYMLVQYSASQIINFRNERQRIKSQNVY